MAMSNSTRRTKIVSFVDSYTKEHGYCPSVREIGCAVGLKSTSTVYARRNQEITPYEHPTTIMSARHELGYVQNLNDEE